MSEAIDRSMRMLVTAREMEKKGKAFYLEASETCRNKVGQEIFSLLADYEDQHIKRIQEIYQALEKGRAWSEDWTNIKPDSDLETVFKKLAREQGSKVKADASDLEALDVGQGLESASIAFYQEHLNLSDDSLEKKFLLQLVLEEKGHFRILADMRYYYSDPAGWLMEKERAGLDGV